MIKEQVYSPILEPKIFEEEMATVEPEQIVKEPSEAENLAEANRILAEFAILVKEGKCREYSGTLRCGVDLGTAYIVLAAVDENNIPVGGVARYAHVVKDGIVVDYIGATRIVQELKKELEGIVGQTLVNAAAAIPPGVHTGSVKAIGNVVESAFFEVTAVVDEPTAAADVLKIKNGAVVDVGGGTTGISIIKNGEVIFTADEATGGTHMTLVIAGAYGIDFEEAEKLKKDYSKQREVFPVIKPVIEKMAAIVKKFIEGYDVDTIYVVGGSSCFDKFESVFEDYTGIKTIKPSEPLLVTPLGIAYNCK